MAVSTPRLLPLGEIRQALGVVTQRYRGVDTIPVGRIVGSLDRTVDFDRDFRPRTTDLAERLDSLRRAYPNGDFPAISVYEVGGAYFVVDGHHRVALSRELGRDYIDADVIELETEYELEDEVDVLTLVHTEQHRRFMEESGLAAVRPDARFELLRPDAYAQLLEIVQAYAYRRSREAGRLLAPAEVAADWYETEYLPAVEAIHAVGLHRRYTYKTDADLFLWIDAKRRSLEPMQRTVSWLDAARAAAGERHGPLTRRRLTREKRRPLPRRRTRNLRPTDGARPPS
jgi:hypothetical protein